jgi:signal transduction histidine kinase
VTARARIVISRAGAALTLCSLLGAFALTVGDTTTTSGDIPSVIIVTVGILGMASVGALLTSRAPGNPVGPLFQLTPAAFSFAIFVSEYGSRWDTDLSGLPAVPLIVELGNLMIPVVVVSLLSTFLLFPDGHLPSRRWRPVAWLLLANGVVGLLTVSVVSPTNSLDTGTAIENPLSVGALSGWTWMAWVWAALLVAAAIPSLASVVVRFRRSHGEERQQIRWLAWASALALFSIAAALVTGIVAGPNGSSTANDVAFTVLIGSITIGLPGACAIAILRYRLYDLDLVIKKAAVFTIVAIVITVVYAAALAIAALSFLGSVAAAILFVLTFNPVRRRARKLAERIVYGQRATPFEVLSEFSERVGETYSIDEVLPRMAQLLAASTGAAETRVWLRTDRRLVPVAVWPADLPAVGDLEVAGDDLPVAGGGVSSFPVTHQGDLLGAITLRLHANDPMDPTKERLVNGLASQAGLALRNVRLVQDLRASRRRIVSAQDERAKRLERDIHDGAQQQLVALAVKIRLTDSILDRDTAAAHGMLAQLQDEANDALENLRDLARGIYPPLLADKGLAAALEGQARKSPVPVALDAAGVGRYPPEVEAAVYFCSLEALNNVAKYAAASSVEVRLAQSDGHLTFEIRDDGTGFDTATVARGTGLQGMSDRVEAIGGSLSVASEPGAGTTVSGRVPVG